MSLPIIDKDMMAKMGIAAGAVPVRPAIDFNFNVPPSVSAAVKPPAAITPSEATEMFGVSQAVKMNFVPQMIIALALDQAAQFVNLCRDRRISDFKKHNRVIRAAVEEYAAGLRKSYGPAFPAYNEYVRRYFDLVDIDRFKMWCSIGNIVNRQIADEKARELVIHIAIIHRLLDYAEEYDRKMDRLITQTMKMPVRRKQADALKIITAICIEFEETWGFKLEPDAMVDTNVLVLSNRATFLADSIIAEEFKCQ